jgi:rhodanese-related sulfurtransferase
MNNKICCVVALLLWITMMTCASVAVPQARAEAGDFETVRPALDAWLKEDKPREISSRDLFDILADEKPANDPFLIDLRYVDSALPNVYSKAHITGAVNIPWRSILEKEVLRTLPRNKRIVVYCYNGHIGRQTATLLSLLGYDAVNLRWGLTSWVCDPSKAEGRYSENEECKPFPVETAPRKASAVYAVPGMKSLGAGTAEVIMARAGVWLRSRKPGEISNEELYEQIMDEDAKAEPFIVDVRKAAEYARGHIKGAVNIYWKDIAGLENLRRLPPERRIVVYGRTGGDEAASVTVILNMLGYDAMNLRWGMTSWTHDREAAPGRYESTRDCAGYPFSTGHEAGISLWVY